MNRNSEMILRAQQQQPLRVLRIRRKLLMIPYPTRTSCRVHPQVGATSESAVPATPSSLSKVSNTLTEVVRTVMETQHRLRSISNARQTHGTHA